jgi:hypothetical protein
MRLSHVATVVIALLAGSGTVPAQTGFPRIQTVNPTTVKIGGTVTAAGENLDKNKVAELFLTDNKNDYRVEISAQSAGSITFWVQDSVKPGRFGLVIRTCAAEGSEAKEYVQPVKLTIE